MLNFIQSIKNHTTCTNFNTYIFQYIFSVHFRNTFATEKKSKKKRGGGCNTFLKMSTQKEKKEVKNKFPDGILKKINFFHF